MYRLAILLVMFLPTLRIYSMLINGQSDTPLIPYPQLTLCLPAALLGIMLGPKHTELRLVGMAWLAGCFAAAAASLTWTEETEQGRAVMVLISCFLGLPIGRLITIMGCHTWSCWCFVTGCVLHFLTIVAFTKDTGQRLGQLAIEGVGAVSNANEFGGLMVAGIAVGVSHLLVGTEHSRSQAHRSLMISWLLIGMFGVLAVGAAMSGSRSALICLALLSGVYTLGTRGVVGRILLIMTVAGVTLLMVAAESEVVQTAAERFSDTEKLQTLGDRWEIWEASAEILSEFPMRGVGMGSVEKYLAAYLVNYDAAERGKDGILRKAPHNAYVEWTLSMGVLGLLPALGVIYTLLIFGTRMDWQEQGMRRQMLVTFCLVFCLTTTLFRLTYWVPISAILSCLMTEKKQLVRQHALPSPSQSVEVSAPHFRNWRQTVPANSGRLPGRSFPRN